MAKVGKKIPQSMIGRAGRMLLSGAKVVAMEAADRLSSGETPIATRIKQTQELVSTIGQLKGAAMKAAQLLSIEFSEMLPPEVVAVLRQLHDDSSFMPFDQVRYILGRQLGAEKLSRLEQLTPEPIAAASIGQVHRALLDGRPVAVKIQYPGVGKSIDADLNVLKRMVLLILQIQGKKVDFEPFFKAVVASLKREADYRIEANSMEQYKALLVNPAYRVPEVIREFSSEQVLTLSFESGIRISDWLKSKPDPEQTRHFARLVLGLVIEEMLINGLVQTDPNFGNFLYLPNEGVLVLLDFGATHSYSLQQRRDLLRIIKLVMAKRHTDAVKACQDLGLVHPAESEESVGLLVECMDLLAQLMHPEYQPFQYRNDAWLKEVRTSATRAGQSFAHTPPPTDLAFLGRKLGGMFHMLKDFEAVVDMTEFRSRIEQLDLG